MTILAINAPDLSKELLSWVVDALYGLLTLTVPLVRDLIPESADASTADESNLASERSDDVFMVGLLGSAMECRKNVSEA